MQSQLTASLGVSTGGLVSFLASSAWSAHVEGGLRPYRLGPKWSCFKDEGLVGRVLRLWLVYSLGMSKALGLIPRTT